MDTEGVWHLVELARVEVGDPRAADAIADRAAALLAEHPSAEILAFSQPFWDLMAISYRADLWAAAYVINGGCSDDAFDYFRGWLITQGRTVFNQVLADPDSLAELPAVLAAAEREEDVECEAMLSVAWNAYRTRTGQELPSGTVTIRYTDLDPDDECDFDDDAEMRRRLPRLAALFLS